MKKILLLLGAFMAFTPQVWSAYQFNDKVTLSPMGREIRETYLTFDSSTTLNLKFDSRVKEFGFYDIDTGSVEKGKFYSPYHKNGLLGTFDTSDRIGIWVKSPTGRYYTSTDTDLKGINNRFVGSSYDIDVDDDDDDVEIDFVIGTHLKRDDGIWELDGFEFEIIGPYANAKPTGQPLPGTLATLALSGIFGWAYYRKKKQN